MYILSALIVPHFTDLCCKTGLRNAHDMKIGYRVTIYGNLMSCEAGFRKCVRSDPNWWLSKSMKSIRKTFSIYRVHSAYLMGVTRKRVAQSEKLWICEHRKPGTYDNYYIHCSNCIKFEGSAFKHDLRNAQNVKIGYWAIMRIFDNLRFWFSIASPVTIYLVSNMETDLEKWF